MEQREIRKVGLALLIYCRFWSALAKPWRSDVYVSSMSVTGDWSRGVTSAGTLEITFTDVRISSILSLLNEKWLIILVTHLLLFVKLATNSWFNSNVLTWRRHGRSCYLFSSSVASSKHNLAKLDCQISLFCFTVFTFLNTTGWSMMNRYRQ